MTDKHKPALVHGPIGPTLIKLTIPMVFGIISIVTFNLVDTFFVGKLGMKELAALGFTLPLVVFINNVALGFGVGTSAVLSRAVGEGNRKTIQRFATDSLLLSVLLVAIFVAAGFLTMDVIFRKLGATPEIAVLTKQYMRIWLPGVLFVVIPMVGNNIIRANGDTMTPAFIMCGSMLLNTILDPLLIFGIGPFPRLEIAGAALATVIARAASMTAALCILYFRDRLITLEIPSFRSVVESWKRILHIALPTAGTRIVFPLATGIITSMISSFGPAFVAAFGVACRIEFFAMTVVFALSTVVGPFVGQNIGAGEHARAKRGISLSKRFSLLWGAGTLVLLATFARPIAGIFSKDPDVIFGIVTYLRIVPVGFGLQGVFVISTTTLNVLRKPMHSAGLCLLQMFALYIPLAHLGSMLFGIAGIFGALAVSYLITGYMSHNVVNRKLEADRLAFAASGSPR